MRPAAFCTAPTLSQAELATLVLPPPPVLTAKVTLAVVVVFGPEPPTEAAEAADDLVEDEEGAVLVTETAEPLEVALLRGKHAACALNGFGDDGSDLVTALGHQRGDGLEVVARYLHHLGQQRSPPLLVQADALGARAAVVRAVIAPRPRDDQLTLRLAAHRVAEPRELHRRVDRLGARAAEEDS